MGACLIMLMLETYMRPSEALSLRAFQVIPPVAVGEGTTRSWSILIRAAELGVPGKTGEFDTSVSLDLARHRLLEPALKRARATRSDNQPLTIMSHNQFAKLFLLAWFGLPLQKL